MIMLMKYSFRVRATQTQRQIDSGTFSVVGYDNLDRVVYTGEWKSALDSCAIREYFIDVQNRFSPTVADLTPGTVTRTFYDRMPARDTLGVALYPSAVQADAFGYGKTRVMAVISDVSANDGGNVARVSTANAYDKYGRVVANYVYDPTLPADSLKMLAVETEYDLGGKVTRTTKYPYGVNGGGSSRKIVERYTYDRLGRIDSLFSRNGGADEVLLATYAYYPTGSVKTVNMGNTITLTYTYHISGAVKSITYSSVNTASAISSNVILSGGEGSSELSGHIFSETLHYEDCGNNACIPQYNGNISRMVHELAHDNADFSQYRDVAYAYDQLNRLTGADDMEQDYFDEVFEYDPQGRMTAQRRDASIAKNAGGEYAYYANTNKLKSVAIGMGGTADDRIMSDANNFVYDSEGNLIEDKSKKMKIFYDWRGMPLTFTREAENGDSLKLEMLYDGSGKRISKALLRKMTGAAEWSVERTTHYTGIGTEIRINNSGNAAETKVVINMPQGLGRYAIEYADVNDSANAGFEWYLKNHLGSTMAVYRTTGTTAGPPELRYAYDYRSYGEKIDLTVSADKVTENYTGKELDDETELGYWGARYLDLMLGMWISVDPARQFSSPYLYAGNGINPVNVVDPNGNYTLNLNEDNTVASMVDDDNLNMVSVFNADGSLFGEFNAPPAQSYFSTENIIGQKFDPNMQAKAEDMLNFAYDMWPVDARGWKTGGELDFKNAYYGKAHNTVGVFNGTIMTARDAGNAMWGGWTKHMYAMPYFLSRFVANAVAVWSNGRLEDSQSSSMQIWGYANFKP